MATENGPSARSGVLTQWTPEDAAFWEGTGKPIANRTLLLSVPALLCAFSVWMYWSILTVQMKNLGFPFTDAQLWKLTAAAGMAGATLRIPNAFLIALSGGRNVIALTTALLLIPTVGAGIALRDINTPFWVFVMLAALSGIGGGNFASSMSNISTFFPKRVQGTALGINAGVGNLGVSAMQFALPWVMTFALFGGLSGAGLALPKDVAGKVAGTPVWIQNGGMLWAPIVALLAIGAWIGMKNLPIHQIGSTAGALGKVLWLLLLGFAATAVGLSMQYYMQDNLKGLITNTMPAYAGYQPWIELLLMLCVVLPATVLTALGLMRFLTPMKVRQNLGVQYGIFKNKHTWLMTILYIMTFGSFIGYSAALPKLIQDVFGVLPGGAPNPNAPSALVYAWIGPFVGSIVRPIGGWLSDRFGGARVTGWDTVLMIASALGVAYYVHAAHGSDTPEIYFYPFLALFVLLFLTTGIGNGSTFRMVPIIFPANQAGPVLGWTSAVAAYGAFVFPNIFGAQIKAGTPQYAFYGFAAYYGVCLVINWWYYARRNAELRC